MSDESAAAGIGLSAELAGVGLLAGVKPPVDLEAGGLVEGLVALVAAIGLLAGVDPAMELQVVGVAEALAAELAEVGLLARVDSAMLHQVVPAADALAADVAEQGAAPGRVAAPLVPDEAHAMGVALLAEVAPVNAVSDLGRPASSRLLVRRGALLLRFLLLDWLLPSSRLLDRRGGLFLRFLLLDRLPLFELVLGEEFLTRLFLELWVLFRREDVVLVESRGRSSGRIPAASRALVTR